MTIPPLVTRTKRMVDVLRERQEMVVAKNTMAYVADILSSRSTRAMTVVIVDVSFSLEIEAGKTCRHMESPDSVFSWYLKMATACGLHVVY